MAYFLSTACTCEKHYIPGREKTYTFTGPCIVSGKEQSVTVKAPDLFKFNQGALIQDAFPELSADDREWMISGMSGDVFDQACAEIDEDETDATTD